MSVSPETVSRLTAKVAAMTMQQRAERAADLIDTQSMREEDNLEFAKLMCGPNAGAEDIADLLRRQGKTG